MSKAGEPEFWKANPAEYIERYKDYERQLAEANTRATNATQRNLQLQAQVAEIARERDAANAALAEAVRHADFLEVQFENRCREPDTAPAEGAER